MQEWKNKKHMECKDTRHIWQLWKSGEKWCYLPTIFAMQELHELGNENTWRWIKGYVKPLATIKQLMDAIKQLQKQREEGWVYTRRGTNGDGGIKWLQNRHVDERQ